ncbi:dihydropteroate synthase [Ruegeria sp. 2205SS24-7]|uniref:dihydropteroate synthase n=1 Tax=Ruegeria discodermiae TaxID=3064389 RepID=UPI002740B977|nr:dihydropteroate synthase [Ruegeria sp. 2205SS24-7]MDP5216769.1 dihydropteroate synthase [Ruegeria sp. 2205SS24-7]
MTDYHRPIVQHGQARPAEALPLAGGPLWFTHVEILSRDTAPRVSHVGELPDVTRARLSDARAPIAGLKMDEPHIMGILNATPDSFSDGGRHATVEAARAAARQMVAHGARILDVGGESTRPGADFVPAEVEIERTAPIISAIASESDTLISIDTRKAQVAAAALDAGAGMVNDVSGFTFDADLAPLSAARGVPVCVMHAQGDPETMQDDPHYENVLLDVFDFLKDRIDHLETTGIPRAQIVADTGIGFGKTLEHNLALLRNIGLFQDLGVPILLGASRKRFIGTIAQEPRADARAPGSIAVALAALAQGVQIIRVHDVAETAQALRLWSAVR